MVGREVLPAMRLGQRLHSGRAALLNVWVKAYKPCHQWSRMQVRLFFYLMRYQPGGFLVPDLRPPNFNFSFQLLAAPKSDAGGSAFPILCSAVSHFHPLSCSKTGMTGIETAMSKTLQACLAANHAVKVILFACKMTNHAV